MVLHGGRERKGQEQRRTPGAAILAGLGLALSAAGLAGVRPATFISARHFAKAHRTRHSQEIARATEQPQDDASIQDNGWYMMPLGVPKVAYRIPGAPNAEWVDIYNRMYRERIIFLGKEIDDRLANEIIGVLLYLDSEDNNKPIYLYINSQGGSVLSGMAIYDTMRHIKSPVVTINVGLSASMASFLLAAGQKGKRIALPHSRIMIHQALGGAQGQAEDIKVEANQILQIHENICRMYSSMTGQPKEKIREDLMRDNFFSAEEAKEYGLIDQVIQISETELPGGGKAQVEEAPKGEEPAVPAPEPAAQTDSGDDEMDTKSVN